MSLRFVSRGEHIDELLNDGTGRVSDPQASRAAADRLSVEIIRPPLDYCTWVFGPKLSKIDRAAVKLRCDYSLNHLEYCGDLIFRRDFLVHRIFRALRRIGSVSPRLTVDKIARQRVWKGGREPTHRMMRPGKVKATLTPVQASC